MNPLLLFPPRLVLRAFDDLHAIAEAARRLPDVEERVASTEERVLERIAEIDGRLAELLALADGIKEGLPAIKSVLDTVGVLDTRVGDVIDLVDRVERDLASLDRLSDSVDQLGETTTTLAAAVGPLQGASERLGRIADRLPGGRAR